MFDEEARREFVTGFRKRKLQRKEEAKKKTKERERLQILEEKKERRDALHRLLESRGLLDTPDISAAVDNDVSTIQEYTDAFTAKTFGGESVVVTTYEGLQGSDGEEETGGARAGAGSGGGGDEDDEEDEDGDEGSEEEDEDNLEDEDASEGEEGAGARAGAAAPDKKEKKRRRKIGNSNRHGRYTESGRKKLRAQMERGPKRVKHTAKDSKKKRRKG